MRKCIALILLAGSQAQAVEIPVAARHHNVSNYCTWSALDTLARTHGIDALVGITRQRWDRNGGRYSDPGYDAEVRRELTSRGVAFEMRDNGSNDRSLLEQYTATHGVVIAWKTGTPTMGCHSVVVTQYDADAGGWVHYYDPSKPLDAQQQPKIWRVERSLFDQWWLGGSIVVFPGSEKLPKSEAQSAAPQPISKAASMQPASVLVQLNTPYLP